MWQNIKQGWNIEYGQNMMERQYVKVKEILTSERSIRKFWNIESVWNMRDYKNI
jgi:hypothetical protein